MKMVCYYIPTMYKNLYQMIGLKPLLRMKLSSERELERKTGLSRMTIRSLIQRHAGARLASWAQALSGLEQDVILITSSSATNADYSIQSVGYRVLKDGERAWKIHLMNFVDEFRRTVDGSLILLPPPTELSVEIKALMASTVHYLCNEVGMDAPPWARRTYSLNAPWFVSESEALKPMMLMESPAEFRRNQIFVGENFLKRA